MTTAYLKWKDHRGSERVYVLDAEEILVGRRSDADVILADPYVSRHHAKLVRGKEGYSIIDLPNAHGTFVNGQRIQQQELRHGDQICLGRDRIELRYLTELSDPCSTELPPQAGELETTWVNFSSILPPESPESAERSDLEKISSLLDFQYQWGKMFSAEKTFEQILRAALKLTGAERAYVLLRQQEEFDYVMGIDRQGERRTAHLHGGRDCRRICSTAECHGFEPSLASLHAPTLAAAGRRGSRGPGRALPGQYQ
jgi:pSer/pThr/pTyr-binding forkhead associated (FHA) protein